MTDNIADLMEWTARDVREMCADYREDQIEVLVELTTYVEERLHSSRAAMIELLTNSRGAPDWTTIQRVMTGRYKSPDTFIRTRVVPALKITRRNVAGVVETPVYLEMMRFMEMVSRRPVMAEISGGAGLGKTFAVHEWHLEHPESIYVDCPTAGGYAGFIRELARKVRVQVRGTLDAIEQALVERIDKRMVIILDEVARIVPKSASEKDSGVRTMNLVQRIHDTTHATVVFVATNVFDNAFFDLRLQMFMAQTHRRILYKYVVPRVSKEVVLAVVRGFRPDVDLTADADRDLLNYALELATTPDGIGPLFEYLQNAALLAADDDAALSLEHLEHAAKFRRDRKKGAA